MSVGELLGRWLAHRDVRPVTRDLYEELARVYVKPSTGALPIARLTPILPRDTFDGMKGRGRARLRGRARASDGQHAHDETEAVM